MSHPTDLVDEQAERAVLGGMLLSPDVADQVAEILTINDWHHPAHAEIYAAITAGRAAGEPTDAVAIAQHLAGADVLLRVGGAPYLHDLLASVPVAAAAPHYARRLAELALRRRVVAASVRISQHALDVRTDTAEMVNSAQQVLHDATVARTARDSVALGDGLDEWIEQVCDPDGEPRGLSTGLGDLDHLIGGLKPGQLVIVGARPAMGKSILGVDIARAASVWHDVPSLIQSMEMSVSEVRMRICSAECNIPLHLITNGRMDADARTKLRTEADRLRKAPIHIDDTPAADLATIRTRARRIQARHGLGLLIVDYLQLMAGTGKSDNRTQEVAANSRGLKVLARELNIPVVAMAQVNRGSEARSDKRPQLSDLRESGGIEADADIVILIHRDDYYDHESPRAGEADLIVAKNRNGPTDTITVAAQLHYARFVDMAVS
jgi:replicative DNA helicase